MQPHFRTTAGDFVDGHTAIELWDGAHLAATLYAQRSGLQIVCAAGYEPGHLEVAQGEPTVAVTIERTAP
jgi:hypothetical protein